MAHILVVEDDVPFSKILEVYLGRKSFQTTVVHTVKNAQVCLISDAFDLVLIDYKLPDGTGIDLIQWIRQNLSKLPGIVVMTSVRDIRVAVNVMRTGAYDYITKPVNPEELLLVIEETLAKSSSLIKPDSVQQSSSGNDEPSGFIKGSSERSVKMYSLVDLVAPTDFHVLLMGESGTGKEHLAREIHHKSKRSDRPFIAVDCGLQSGQLVASELFGHVKGAFTGAVAEKKGVLELVNGGTLFLDELGNMSYEVQIKLLRALQERSFNPVGSTSQVKFDARIISATNVNLPAMAENGVFRLDLLHRINEFVIEVPSLRERLYDLPEFVDFFVQQACRELQKQVVGADHAFMRILEAYDWPGNIRELRNIIRRAVLLTNKPTLGKETLPPEFGKSRAGKEVTPLKDVKEESEKELILKTLKECRFNKSLTASVLGIDRKTLYNKLSRYQIL